MRTYKLDFEVGYGCNFRCKYCFERMGAPGYADKAMTPEVADRGILYVRHVLEKLPEDSRLAICFFGGEPLLYPDIITRAVEDLQTEAVFNIVTNGSLIQQNRDLLLRLKSLVGERLRMRVSYDYALQEEYRQQGSYQTVRDNIRWLYDNGFPVSTITTVSEDALPWFDRVFSDYLKLRGKCMKLPMKVNVVRGNVGGSFDEAGTKTALFRVVKWLEKHDALELVRYNAGCGYRGERYPGCVFGRAYAGIYVNGDIYPGYSVIHDDETIRKAMYLGNVNEEFSVLDEKREELIESLNHDISGKCSSCVTPCQLLPWSTIKTGVQEFNAMPEENHCRIHKLVKKYLPHE